jgi:hypothetical protein
MKKHKYKEKLDQLVQLEGYSNTRDWLNDNMMAGTVMGICFVKSCDYTTEVEPDQPYGYCEVCQTKTVKSGLVLAGY